MEIIGNNLGLKELVSVEPSDIDENGVLNIPEGVEFISDFLMVNAREVDTGEGCEYIVNPIEGVTDVVKTINVPASVTIVGKGAFATLSQLQEINFPKNSELRKIERNAFTSCSSLQNITIPEGVVGLEERTFQGCKKLVNVNKEGEPFKYIDDWCFSGCDLKQIRVSKMCASHDMSCYAFYNGNKDIELIIEEGTKRLIISPERLEEQLATTTDLFEEPVKANGEEKPQKKGMKDRVKSALFGL